MSKPKTKAQTPEAQAPATAEKPMQVVNGDGSGEALPVVAEEPVEQVAEAVPQPKTAPTSNIGPDTDPEEVIDAFVLCDGSLNGVTRYRAGCVLQGVPESLAETNRHWLDTNSAAVEHAMNSGADVVGYEQKA